MTLNSAVLACIGEQALNCEHSTWTGNDREHFAFVPQINSKIIYHELHVVALLQLKSVKDTDTFAFNIQYR